jgi:hypothetical protein
MHNLVLSPISTDTLIESIALRTAEIIEGRLRDTDKKTPTYPKNFGISVLQDLIEEETGKRPEKQTIYGLTYNRKIPFDKPPGTKQLRFNRDEIIKWLNNGRQVSHLKEDQR